MIARFVTLVVALFLLGRLGVRYKRGELSLRRSLFWAGPWIVLTIVMLSPDLVDTLATRAGVETATGIDFMAYIAVGVAFYILYRLFIRLDRIERDLTKLVRHLALIEAPGPSDD